MDDPYGSLSCIIVFLLFLVIGSIVNGYAEAFGNGSFADDHSEDAHDELNDRRIRPRKLHSTIHLINFLIWVVFSIWQLPHISTFLTNQILKAKTFSETQTHILFLVTYLLSWCIFLLLYLGFSVIAPQKIAIQKEEKWLSRYSGFVSMCVILFSPLTFLSEKIGNIVVRLFRLDPAAADADVTEEEIISMVNEGHEKGLLQDTEVEMIHNIFDLNDTDAKDIMTHRKNIVAIDGNMTLEEALPLVIEQGHSRFPVYRRDIDDLIGILHIRNLLQIINYTDYKEISLAEIPDLLHPVSYIPETRSIDGLFRDMQREKNHMVIVVDEYGQTAGVVSMEDILEEIVGNIQDEYDEEEEMIVRCGESSWLIQGFTPLEDIEELLEISFEDEEHDTLNGYLIAQLDRIPQEGEEPILTRDNMRFQILRVDNKAIQSVLVTKLPRIETEEENEE